MERSLFNIVLRVAQRATYDGLASQPEGVAIFLAVSSVKLGLSPAVWASRAQV